ncbi:hypothetical protein EYF80_000607 [Liparis tanakae]|uniref:Uncharacterized protein n=1 Tax=Liparis tanakae TaxID=230148 RepID=A0A4Z2JGC9_9TELE|nr:hypothetical protein EYF80_000607 [Liparis tanakae]
MVVMPSSTNSDETVAVNAQSSLSFTSSCCSLSLTSMRLIFPSAEREAKENRRVDREDGPGVSRAGGSDGGEGRGNMRKQSAVRNRTHRHRRTIEPKLCSKENRADEL